MKHPTPAAPPPPKPPVCIELHSDPHLQWYQESAHTLYVRLFPLTSADAFDAAQPADLLGDPPPALAGAVGVPRSVVLYPGQTETVKLEVGPQEFTDVGIVAGYYKPMGPPKLVVHTAGPGAGSCIAVRFGEALIEGLIPQEAPSR